MFLQAFQAASASTSSSLSSTAELVENRDLSRQGAIESAKEALQACSASGSSDVEACVSTDAGSTIGEMDSSSRLNYVLREASQELIAERVVACIAAGSTETQCTVEAQAYWQGLTIDTITSADVADALSQYRRSLYIVVFDSCTVQDKTTFDSCMVDADASNVASGGRSGERWTDVQWGAFRDAAEAWVSCWDSVEDTSTCEGEAKAYYANLGGEENEWELKDKKQIRALADASAKPVFR